MTAQNVFCSQTDFPEPKDILLLSFLLQQKLVICFLSLCHVKLAGVSKMPVIWYSTLDSPTGKTLAHTCLQVFRFRRVAPAVPNSPQAILHSIWRCTMSHEFTEANIGNSIHTTRAATIKRLKRKINQQLFWCSNNHFSLVSSKILKRLLVPASFLKANEEFGSS